MSNDEKGFAARWSKRKAAARQDDDTEDAVQVPELSDADERGDAEAEKDGDSEVLTEEDFEDVDFDALDKSSDYTRFARANVPAAIQQKALRKLWASDSVFEVMDGMNDYDEDFTGNGLAGKVLKTAYKVGRGFLSDDAGEGEPEERSEFADDKALANQQFETTEIADEKNAEADVSSPSEVPDDPSAG